MKHLLLIAMAVSAAVVFTNIDVYAASSDQEKEKKTVEVPLVFSKVDGRQGVKPKMEEGWFVVQPGEKIRDVTEVIYEGIIKVYKVNPCYICMGRQCYVNPNC